MENVEAFLRTKGIVTPKISRELSEGRNPAYRLEINSVADVLKVAKAMLRYSVKKAEDLRIAVEYIEGRISGSQAIEMFDDQVRNKRRSGFVRWSALPLTRTEGIRRKELENASKARAAYAVNVPLDTQAKIRREHDGLRLGIVRLSRKYGYSESVIKRILRGS